MSTFSSVTTRPLAVGLAPLGFAATAALAAAVIAHHVPWRDELQAFLLARDAGGPVALFHTLAYEGHPGLWHGLLYVLVQFIDTPVILKVAQIPVTAAILWLLWMRAPFSFTEKLLLSLGSYFLFEYGAIARGYGLGVALFFAFVALRNTPWAWLALGLMANTSIHFTALGGICALLLMWRGNRPWLSMAACLALALFALWTAWPAHDTVTAVPQGPATLGRLAYQITWLSAAIFPLGWTYDPLTVYGVPQFSIPAVRLVLGIFTITAGAFSLRGDKALMAAFLATAVALLAIGTLIFGGYDRHYGILWIALIGLHWIKRAEKPAPSGIYMFRAWTTLSVLATIALFPLLWGPFSAGDQAAAWIKRHAAPDTVIGAYRGWMGIDISAYLDRPTYNLQAQRWNTFIRWDHDETAPASAKQIASLIEEAPPGPLFIVGDLGDADAMNAFGELMAEGYPISEAARFRAVACSLVIYRVDRLG